MRASARYALECSPTENTRTPCCWAWAAASSSEVVLPVSAPSERTTTAGATTLAFLIIVTAVETGLDLTVEEALLLEANHFGLLSSTADMREGTSAFLAKRKPEWKGC